MHRQALRVPRSFVTVAAVLLSGCASGSTLSSGVTAGPSIETANTQHGDRMTSVPEFKSAQVVKVDVQIADVWPRLIKAYSDVGIPLTTVQPGKFFLGNEGMKRSHTLGNQRLSSYLNCGVGGSSGGDNADVYSVNMSVVTQLTSMADNGTEVATLIQATATPMTFGTAAVVCSTTGRLERRIATEISGSQE